MDFFVDSLLRWAHILSGMMFAIGMWCVLWFVIWPAQKKILAAREQGADAPESAVRRAALFSKLNGMMLGPMLLLMIFAHNYTTFSYSMLGLIMVMGIAAMGGLIKSAEVLNHRQS